MVTFPEAHEERACNRGVRTRVILLDEGWTRAAERHGAQIHAVGGVPSTKHAKRRTAAMRQTSGHWFWEENGAGEAIRTPDPNLGKVVLYP